MNIRPETPADYAAIARIHALAFGERADEAVLVGNLLQRRQYDPALSLVAEISGTIAGHALFMPYRLRLSGQTIEAVNLAPIGVHPSYQRQGVGMALMDAGHQIAKSRGYAFCFLLGHTSYYPRFGYQTRAFGVSSVKIAAADLASADTLESRPLTHTGIPMLHSLWENEEGAVDFSLEPGTDLLDWLPTNSYHTARVYLRDGVIVGYSRRSLTEIQYFLAVDHQAARGIALDLALARNEETITLPLHPSPFDDYYAAVQAGNHHPGRPNWPPAFDL